MSIEATQDQAKAVVFLFPFITPVLVVSIIACFVFRRARWIAPFWVFAVCPVLVLIGLLLRLFLRTGGGSGPDWGFVGMATMFILLFSLWEVIPGILLLLAYPRGRAWGSHAILPCLIAAALSFIGSVVAIPHLPKPPY